MPAFRTYYFLTFALVVYLFVLTPLRATFELTGVWSRTAFTALLLAAVVQISTVRGARYGGFALAAIATLAGWLAPAQESGAWVAVELSASLAFLILTTVVLVRAVVRAPRVSADVISGSFAAYLLIALSFSLGYALCFLADPFSISLPEAFAATPTQPYTGVGDPRTATFVYFSLVTLTTLGYGDISPVSPAAVSLASFEAVVGQLYLTVLVARLVGLHIAGGNAGASEDAP